MTTVNTALLVAPQFMPASDTLFYQSPTNQSARIARAIFFNNDTSAHTIKLYLTNSTSGLSTQLMQTQVGTLATYVSPELAGLVIPAGFMLRGLADMAAFVTIAVSGLIIVG